MKEDKWYEEATRSRMSVRIHITARDLSCRGIGMQWSINKSITDRPKPIMLKILPMKFSNFAPTFLCA